MGRQIKFDRLIIAIIFPIILLLGCVSKENIKVPLSEPMSHPMLALMQSMSIEEKDGAIYFGESRKYNKRGVTVVVLKGEPYEMGYARGMMLKSEIRDWVQDFLYQLNVRSFGTSIGENLLKKRAKEVEEFIPDEYKEELRGLSAGSKIDYEMLLILNVLATIVNDVACTSVVVKSSDGSLLRSRNLDLSWKPPLPAGLYICKPTNGYAFVSISHSPELIGTRTAFNEKGLSFGAHDIGRASKGYVKGTPDFILRREVIQYAGSVSEAGEILNDARRTVSKMWLVADTETAGVYEYNNKEVAFHKMDEDQLILTNHTRMLKIGRAYDSSHYRYSEANSFLLKHRGEMDVKKLIELNRGYHICWKKYPEIMNLHSAIFKADTLDFWVAIDAPPATKGKWIGFNLKKELYGNGSDPEPLMIAAEGSALNSHVKINKKEPWTGKWRVESTSYGSGLWAMKQEGQTVISTRDSAYEFKGTVRGKQLKGRIVETGLNMPVIIEMPSDGLTFEGTLDYLGRSYTVKGKRIE